MPDPGPVSSPPIVLVVDDNEAIRMILNRVLTRSGFAVSLVASGTEALQIYRQYRAAITLVLLDIRLPDMDGPTLLAQLQTLNPLVRCWFMTGDLGCYTDEDLLRRGAALTLRKPFNLAEFQQALAGLAAEGIPCSR